MLGGTAVQAPTLYSSVDEDNSSTIRKAFTEATGVKVDRVFLSSGPVADRGRKEQLESDVAVVFPSEGVGYEVAAMSIPNGAPNLVDANKLVDWMTSAEGQQTVVDLKAYFPPIRGDVKAGDGVPSLDEIKLIAYDPAYHPRTRDTVVVHPERNFAASSQIDEAIYIKGGGPEGHDLLSRTRKPVRLAPVVLVPVSQIPRLTSESESAAKPKISESVSTE